MPKHARHDGSDDDLPHSKIPRLGESLRASSERTNPDARPPGLDIAQDLLSSLDEKQLAELVKSPTLSPAASVFDAGSSQDRDEEIPYEEPRTPGRVAGARPALSAKAEREASRRSRLMQHLGALPRDVRNEYLGPHFDFDNKNALQPYEDGLGIDRFSRISWQDVDIPNVVIELHPHLYVSLEKFKEIATCVKAAGDDTVFSDNLWKRFALVEAPPYRSDNPYKGLCKPQQAAMDEELAGTRLLDLKNRRKITSRYQAGKLVDAGTYMTLKQLSKQSYRSAACANHLDYLKSTIDLEKHERLQLFNFNNQSSKMPPQILARKGDQTFISGEMVSESRALLKASTQELHSEEQIQLMARFPSGDPTGEYRSLFTHAKGNFAGPSRMQAEQLGFPSDHDFLKENEFEEKHQHRDHFYASMNPIEGANARLEKDNLYLFRQMDFDAIIESDYHKLRVAVSLLEDDVPLDLDRCERVKTLLGLDDRLRYRDPTAARPRDRDAGRS